MPAFRRFLAHILPKFFGSTEDNVSIRAKGRKPETPSSSGKKSSKRKKTLPDSLFVSTIMKTVDTRVSSSKPQDDELQLVELGINNIATESNDNMTNTVTVTEERYKAYNKATLLTEW
ncbi:hypothetical protein E8E13_004600 [Curvularia kusanoi]|uniref:Uncharacterized protein n=1 Tax=Curvularia kusanoi TaxID=90978 RepID=A0A9P4TE86_CURKU|nr:hypothetical protein E8E13_004600 [Curvularia kusanoi]